MTHEIKDPEHSSLARFIMEGGTAVDTTLTYYEAKQAILGAIQNQKLYLEVPTLTGSEMIFAPGVRVVRTRGSAIER
jgi:hypothetical protein